MNILKFKQYLYTIFNKINETFVENGLVNGWKIKYNHSEFHNLNLKILDRTDIKSKKDMMYIIEKIIYKLNYLKIDKNDDIIFSINKFKCKVVCKISKDTIYIITILGIDFINKTTDKIIKI